MCCCVYRVGISAYASRAPCQLDIVSFPVPRVYQPHVCAVLCEVPGSFTFSSNPSNNNNNPFNTMVNGPRPNSISKPVSAAASLATPNARTQSPMVLQRQATSMYSTCSTATLVFGKAATPLAGEWSAEPWDPSNLRPTNLTAMLEQAEPEVVELETDETDDHTIQETASVAETTAFSDKMQRTHTAQTAPATAQSAPHVAFIYRYDPYSAQRAKRELYRCECDDCIEGLACGLDNLTAGSYSYALPPQMQVQPQHVGMEVTNSDEYRVNSYEYEEAASTSQTTSYRGPQYRQYESAPYWTAPQEPAVDPAVPPPSPFVPPPPPPKITRGIVAESAEGALDADAAFYHIAMRWYAKTAAVQERFVTNGDMCPAPQREGESFQQWVDAVGKWWLRQFEFAQTKTSASSGMLRTATAPAHARLPGSNGFETHASIADSFASHKRALRSFPHREMGISGLTEAILRNHEKSSVPTPRSRQRLPW
jgi:hypothetical protein